MTESLTLNFRPDRERAQGVAGEMNRRLAESFRHIIDRARAHITLDEARLQPVLRALDSSPRVRPAIFGIYNDMLAAVAVNDTAGLAGLFEELRQTPVRAEELTIRAFDPDELGPGDMDRIRRYAGAEAASVSLYVPDPEDVAVARERLARAIETLRLAAPECFEELEAIISEIILIASDPALDVPDFLGISAFELWGAIVINPVWRHETVFDIAEDLVHEATHELLFGFSLDEPLVLNSASERFASPLRTDPRPMDGIFHATFVVARVHYVLSRMCESGVMADADTARSRLRLAGFEKGFGDGLAVIREHGDLTPTGRQVLQGAEDYMAEQAH